MFILQAEFHIYECLVLNSLQPLPILFCPPLLKRLRGPFPLLESILLHRLYRQCQWVEFLLLLSSIVDIVIRYLHFPNWGLYNWIVRNICVKTEVVSFLASAGERSSLCIVCITSSSLTSLRWRDLGDKNNPLLMNALQVHALKQGWQPHYTRDCLPTKSYNNLRLFSTSSVS